MLKALQEDERIQKIKKDLMPLFVPGSLKVELWTESCTRSIARITSGGGLPAVKNLFDL